MFKLPATKGLLLLRASLAPSESAEITYGLILNGIIRGMPQESSTSLTGEIASFQETRAQEVVRRRVQEPSRPPGVTHFYSILGSAP